MNRTLIYWACQLLGWSLYTVMGLAFAAASRPITPSVAVAYLFSGIGAIAVSHFYRWTMRRSNWMQLRLRDQVPRLLGASFVFGSLAGLIAIANAVLLTGMSVSPIVLIVFMISWSVGMLYWSVIYTAVHGVEKSGTLQLAVKDAQLQALLAQVNPHFLFNSLNSLRGLIAEDTAKAQEMVTQLAHLLRYSLESTKHRTVPLVDELNAVRNYLACEKIRFENQLLVEWNVADDALEQQVPPMVIQTLVENGVKHGLAQSVESGLLRVSARCETGGLVVEVCNKGRLNPQAGNKGTGIASARDRVQLIYGSGASIALLEEPAGFVLARLTIPGN